MREYGRETFRAIAPARCPSGRCLVPSEAARTARREARLVRREARPVPRRILPGALRVRRRPSRRERRAAPVGATARDPRRERRPPGRRGAAASIERPAPRRSAHRGLPTASHPARPAVSSVAIAAEPRHAGDAASPPSQRTDEDFPGSGTGRPTGLRSASGSARRSCGARRSSTARRRRTGAPAASRPRARRSIDGPRPAALRRTTTRRPCARA